MRLEFDSVNSSTRPTLLFCDISNNNDKLGFAHDDFNESYIIVNNDMIVGIIGWEMAGFFGRMRVGNVHSTCWVLKREDFANLNLNEESTVDLIYWNELYAEFGRVGDLQLIATTSSYHRRILY